MQQRYINREISTKDIHIDDKGQRDVSRRKAQFNKIMREFDDRLVQPIDVALIDGKYWCFDGQMTMKVLKARAGGKDVRVKCRVYEGMSKMDAAYMFIKQRGTVSRVDVADKIRVNANYGDENSVKFIRITESNGLEIAWNGYKAKNSVVAVSTLWQEFISFSDDEMFASYIRVIKNSWNGDPDGSKSQILKGLGMFMRTYRGEFQESRLITKLQTRHPNDIIRDAQIDRSSGARKYAVQILLAYNHGAREENRLPNIL